ncbi:MAG: hypothetical protein ACC658_00365 [Acidimicrobiia bacterium]
MKAAQVGLGWWGSQVTKILKDSEKIGIDLEPTSPVRAAYEHWADAVAGLRDYRFSNEKRLGNVAILEALARSPESRRPEPVSHYS